VVKKNDKFLIEEKGELIFPITGFPYLPMLIIGNSCDARLKPTATSYDHIDLFNPVHQVRVCLWLNKK